MRQRTWLLLDIDGYTAMKAAVSAATEEMGLCEVQRARSALDHITNKWAVLILTVLCPEPARFNELLRRLEGITHKALSEALKRLERNGLITRSVLTTSPIGVEYAITDLGHSLREPFQALYAWTLEYGPALEQARCEFDAAKALEKH